MLARPHALAFGLALVLLVAVLPPGATGQEDVDFDTREFRATGVDTVVFELTTTDGFETLDNSYLDLAATFPQANDTQRAAIVTGLVQDAHDEGCSACFLDLAAATIEDVAVAAQPEDNGDLRLDTGPGLDVALETGHDHDHIGHASASIDLAHLDFPHAGGASTAYQVFVSVPGAVHLDGEFRYVVKGEISLTGESLTDTGYAHWVDDMRAAGSHSAAGNVYVGDDGVCGQGCGEIALTPGDDQRVFGAIGPSQSGFYNAHVDPTGNHCEECLGPIPATFAGQWGAATPDWIKTTTGVGSVTHTSPSAAVATVPGYAHGSVTYFVDQYVTLGPQDLVAAGFLTPLDPA